MPWNIQSAHQYFLLILVLCTSHVWFNTMRPRQNGRHFADDIFKCLYFNENGGISIKISLKFVTKGPINKIPALFQIMAWRRPGDKPLSEAILVSILTHKCATQPQWDKVWTGPEGAQLCLYISFSEIQLLNFLKNILQWTCNMICGDNILEE